MCAEVNLLLPQRTRSRYWLDSGYRRTFLMRLAAPNSFLAAALWSTFSDFFAIGDCVRYIVFIIA